MSTFVLPRPVADRLALGSIVILVACAAGCQSDVADQQSSSTTTPAGQSQGKGGDASTSKSSNSDQGGADGSGNANEQGGERASSTSESDGPKGGDSGDSDAGGASSTDSERGGTGPTSNRGGAANGGSSSVAQATTATGGRFSRTSGTGGRTQFGSSSGGRSAGGQATGGKSQAGEATGGKSQGGSATGGKAQGGSSAGGAITGGSSASSTSASTAPNADAQAYVDATNEVRAAVTAPANYSGTWVPLPNVTWSEEVAASAQQWANHLRDAENCGLVHEKNTGLGENLAMGTRLTPAEAVRLWASEKSKFTYSSPFSYTAEAGHYTQLVWRTSIEIGCASASCGNSVVISCRYKPPGNVIGGKIY